MPSSGGTLKYFNISPGIMQGLSTGFSDDQSSFDNGYKMVPFIMQLTAASHLQYQDGIHAWSCCFPTPTAWGAGIKGGELHRISKKLAGIIAGELHTTRAHGAALRASLLPGRWI